MYARLCTTPKGGERKGTKIRFGEHNTPLSLPFASQSMPSLFLFWMRGWDVFVQDKGNRLSFFFRWRTFTLPLSSALKKPWVCNLFYARLSWSPLNLIATLFRSPLDFAVGSSDEMIYLIIPTHTPTYCFFFHSFFLMLPFLSLLDPIVFWPCLWSKEGPRKEHEL